MTTQQVIQLLVVLLIVGSSFFGWLFKQIQEQRERKRIRDEQERRRDEMLRTGRDVYGNVEGPQTIPTTATTPLPSDPESARREELARRRREQIEELRRRAAARQAGQRPAPTPARAQVPSQPPSQTGPGQGGPPQDLVIQLPGGRVLRIPAPQQPQPQQRQTQQSPSQPQMPQPGPQRPVQQPRPKRQPKPRPQPTSQPAAFDPAYSGESTTETRLGKPLSVPQTPEEVYAIPSGAVRPISVMGRPMTPAEWRRTLMLREILDRPLALRDPTRMTDPLT